jgi:hypothetical protein
VEYGLLPDPAGKQGEKTMKKWMLYTLIAVCTAGSASAAWWPFGSKKQTEKPAAIERPRPDRPGMQHKRPEMSEEQRAKIEKGKAEREAIHKLAEAARNETDPAKKAELVDALRAKVTAGAEKMQAEFRQRLEKAEEGVEKMKKRLADAEKNKQQKVEEQVQRLLSGEAPKRPEGAPHKKGPPPPAGQ